FIRGYFPDIMLIFTVECRYNHGNLAALFKPIVDTQRSLTQYIRTIYADGNYRLALATSSISPIGCSSKWRTIPKSRLCISAACGLITVRQLTDFWRKYYRADNRNIGVSARHFSGVFRCKRSSATEIRGTHFGFSNASPSYARH